MNGKSEALLKIGGEISRLLNIDPAIVFWVYNLVAKHLRSMKV